MSHRKGDIVVSYELDTHDVPTFVIGTVDDENRIIILASKTGENGVLNLTELINKQ